MRYEAVDYDPFDTQAKYEPVDYDPFQGATQPQPMDVLNVEADPLKHFKRIPQAYEEMTSEGMKAMKEGNILEKGLGALQWLTAPLNAPVQALVGEPTQSVA